MGYCNNCGKYYSPGNPCTCWKLRNNYYDYDYDYEEEWFWCNNCKEYYYYGHPCECWRRSH